MIPPTSVKNESSTNRLNLADPRISRAFDALLEPLSAEDGTPLPTDIAQRITSIPDRLSTITSETEAEAAS